LTHRDDDGIVVVMEMDASFVATLATKADLKPLATKEHLAAAVARLATKDELAAAIAPLATRQEMDAAITRAVAPLPTRAEMDDAIRAEGVETRRHFDVVAERLQSSISLIAKRYLALDRKVDDLLAELKADIANPDRRVTRRESRRN
jgi:hypothetical protein